MLLVRAGFVLSPSFRGADGVLIDGSEIIGVVSQSGGEPPDGCRVLHFPGAAVLPGFIDAHTHFLQTGLNLGFCDLGGAGSLEEALERISSFRTRGEWLLAFGLEEETWREPQMPAGMDLDRAVPGKPVFVSRKDLHSCVLNSRGMERLEVWKWNGLDPDSKKGIFRGTLNGRVRERVFALIPPEEKKAALARAADLAVSRGITTVHALEGGFLFGDRDIDLVLQEQSSLPVHLLLYPQTTDVRFVRDRGLKRIGGCILADGSLGSRTAALDEPYSDRPQERGKLNFTDGELGRFVEAALKENMQVALHAIGERAIRQVAECYSLALSMHPGEDSRLRIEHCELPPPEAIEKIRSRGIHLSVQPAFEHLWGGPGKMYEKRLGVSRLHRTNPLRTFIDNGISLAGGSDSDVTPMDPLLGIFSAVSLPNAAERLTMEQALDAFTMGGARAGFEEDSRGSIEIGKKADLVVLSANPLEVASEELLRIRVLATIVGGKVRHLLTREPEFPPPSPRLD